MVSPNHSVQAAKLRKNDFLHFGKLTDEQAAKIRLLCKVISNPDEQVTTLANIVVQECVSYLDVAVVNLTMGNMAIIRCVHLRYHQGVAEHRFSCQNPFSQSKTLLK